MDIICIALHPTHMLEITYVIYKDNAQLVTTRHKNNNPYIRHTTMCSRQNGTDGTEGTVGTCSPRIRTRGLPTVPIYIHKSSRLSLSGKPNQETVPLSVSSPAHSVASYLPEARAFGQVR